MNSRDSWLYILISLIVFGVFLSMGATDVYWGETSLMTSRAFQIGSANPPGYPFFVQALSPFQRIPVGDIPFRSNLFGLLLAAVLTSVIISTSRTIFNSPVFLGLPVALVFIFSPLAMHAFSSVEVYSLNLIFISLVIGTALAKEWTVRTQHIIALMLGLMVTHHLTSILLLPSLLWILIRRKRIYWQSLPISIVFGVMGISVYLFLPIREHAAALNVWGNPDHWQSFLQQITAYEESSGSFLSSLRAIDTIGFRATALTGAVVESYTIWGCCLILPGVICLWQNNRHAMEPLLLYLFILFVATSVYNSHEYVSFFLPGLFLIALFIGAAFHGLYHFLHRRGFHLLAGSIVGMGVLLLVIPAGVTSVRTRIEDVHIPRSLIQDVSDRLVDSDLIITQKSDIAFLLEYFKEVERRHDCYVIFQHLLSFRWYYRELVDRHAPFAPERILEYPFEDSHSWNCAITAMIVKRQLNSGGRVYIDDPAILRDAVAAGLKNYRMTVCGYGALITAGVPTSGDCNKTFVFTGRVDPVSLQQLGRHYSTQATLLRMTGQPVSADQSSEKAGKIYETGKTLKWWK